MKEKEEEDLCSNTVSMDDIVFSVTVNILGISSNYKILSDFIAIYLQQSYHCYIMMLVQNKLQKICYLIFEINKCKISNLT